MQTRITPEEMQAASRQLAKTEAGREAMARLLPLLEGGHLELGILDQRAFLALLGGAWTGQRTEACKALRGAAGATTDKA